MATHMDKAAVCLICGEKLDLAENATGMQCLFCGESYYTNEVCVNGHYVCDACRSERAYEMIFSGALKSKQTDAIAIAYELMMNKWVRLHGPEHHFLVTAVLLAAYNNQGYGKNTLNWDLAAHLEEARERSLKMEGGYCGSWGCCGAGFGAGLFATLLLRATPLSVAERGAANLLTAKVLEQIALLGGPRCCKRETFTAIFASSRFAAENWGMPLTEFQSVECHFFYRNAECIAERCPYYPNKEESAAE